MRVRVWLGSASAVDMMVMHALCTVTVRRRLHTHPALTNPQGRKVLTLIGEGGR